MELKYPHNVAPTPRNDTDAYWLSNHGVTVAAFAETLNMKRAHVALVLAAIAGQGGTDDSTAISVFLDTTFNVKDDE